MPTHVHKITMYLFFHTALGLSDFYGGKFITVLGPSCHFKSQKTRFLGPPLPMTLAMDLHAKFPRIFSPSNFQFYLSSNTVFFPFPKLFVAQFFDVSNNRAFSWIIGSSKEYWLAYRGPSGFLTIGWFGSSPTPFPLLPSGSCLSFSVFCVSPVELTERRGGEGCVGVAPTHTTARKPGPL